MHVESEHGGLLIRTRFLAEWPRLVLSAQWGGLSCEPGFFFIKVWLGSNLDNWVWGAEDRVIVVADIWSLIIQDCQGIELACSSGIALVRPMSQLRGMALSSLILSRIHALALNIVLNADERRVLRAGLDISLWTGVYSSFWKL